MNKTRSLLWAIQKLTEAILEFREDHDDTQYRPEIQSALTAKKYIDEFLNGLKPLIEFNDTEKNRSASIHTFFRKGDDSPYGNIIYALWNEGRGVRAW